MAANDAVARLRAQLDDFVSDEDVVRLDDDAWWDKLTELVNAVLAERARAKREANLWIKTGRTLHTHDAGEYRDPETGCTEVEAHRFSFEGSTTQLAEHLIDGHGVGSDVAQPWRGGLTQGDWNALDVLHKNAHRGEATS
jgi:hypothetical protein